MMSRTKKGQKGPGHEYWSKRPLSSAHGAVPGRITKDITNGKERMAARKLEKKEKKDKE